MSSRKRHFPWKEKEPSCLNISKKKTEGDIESQIEADGGEEGSDSPKAGDHYTDFSTWNDEDIKEFLSRRGEDFCSGLNRANLIFLAARCELNTGKATVAENQNTDEVDPLDEFMANIDAEVITQNPEPASHAIDSSLACDEEADPIADYMEARKKKVTNLAIAAAANIHHGYNSDEEVYAMAKAVDEGIDAEYDSDDNLIIKKKNIEPLPALDHSLIEYEEFEKDFYEPCPEISKLSKEEVEQFRRSKEIKVAGFDVPDPIMSFAHCGFDLQLAAVIKKQNYDKPTPIQAQALPAVLSGRDVLGIAKTGSGKTAAFVLPMVIHIMAQPELKENEGPIGVIVAPTRELTEQIHKQLRIFSKPYGLSVCAAFGGLSKYEQIKQLKAGCDAVVSTPGRLIDLVKMKACTMKKTTYLVLDEADKMFDMGFEPQIRSIVGQIRPDRQTLLFSATMPRRIEYLARDILSDPIRITVGKFGANKDIMQFVHVLENDEQKVIWLEIEIRSLVDNGDVLIFANQKSKVDEIVEKLKITGVRASSIHGDMDQHTRMGILKKFRSGELHVLVATDIAARGLDIRSVKTVVNYDCAKNADGHIHRVGRTGRAGDTDGIAHTLLLSTEVREAGYLVRSLIAAGQEVSDELYKVASKDNNFKRSRSGGKDRRKVGGGGGLKRGAGRIGGAGLGFSEEQPSYTPASTTKDSTKSAKSLVFNKNEVMGTADRNLRNYHSSLFHNSFVVSGVQGEETGKGATIIAPRQAASRPLPPPPTPVTVAPIIRFSTGNSNNFSTAKQSFTNNNQRPIYNPIGSFGVSVVKESKQSDSALNEALAAAEEIAARLGARATLKGKKKSQDNNND